MAKYFQHIAPISRAAFYWRDSHRERYADIQVHINLNLLATAVGDTPQSELPLVSTASYDTRVAGVGSIDVQPFVELRGNNPVELPIGPNLKNILDYPLGNEDKMNLSLPFYDPAVGIGDNGGGWFRNFEDDSAYHGGWDVTPISQSSADLFEVCAAADGTIIGITKGENAPIVIQHSAGGNEFLTIYQHLDLSNCKLNVDDPVKRGQLLARITGKKEVPHLHFMVAIKGPEFTHTSGKIIPSLWYAIDPFGVYDYYKNRTDLRTYNYLPDRKPDCFTHRIQGSCHIIQWATQPLINTVPITKQTDYIRIIRMQIRDRQSHFRQGLPPAKAKQSLIWLDGFEDYFFIPFDPPSEDNAIELKMIDFLMQCLNQKRKVKVEYYPLDGKNFISAVWANA